LSVLRSVVDIYDSRHLLDDQTTSDIYDRDWEYIDVYLKVVGPFDAASKLLGGDTYPSASMVIPMLDQVSL
jgi:hypothetical protein